MSPTTTALAIAAPSTMRRESRRLRDQAGLADRRGDAPTAGSIVDAAASERHPRVVTRVGAWAVMRRLRTRTGVPGVNPGC